MRLRCQILDTFPQPSNFARQVLLGRAALKRDAANQRKISISILTITTGGYLHVDGL